MDHTDATVSHIVALLGFSFQVAKTRCFPLTSKQILSFYNFSLIFLFCFKKTHYLCTRLYSSEKIGRVKQLKWKPEVEDSSCKGSQRERTFSERLSL